MEIHVYHDHHHDGVVRLLNQAFPDSAPRNRPETVIRAKQALQPELFFVAVDGGSVVGTVMAGYDGHRGWIYALAVDLDRRRQGIGRALVRHAEARLTALGCPKVNLQVRADNAAVVGFYENLGFEVEERISMGRLLDTSETA